MARRTAGQSDFGTITRYHRSSYLALNLAGRATKASGHLRPTNINADDKLFYCVAIHVILSSHSRLRT